MSSGQVAPQKIAMTRFRSPSTVIGWFVARRTLVAAVLWALTFGAYVASKAIGLVDAYPTAADLQKLAATFSHNVGFEMMFGRAPQVATAAAYAAWNVVSVMVIIGSIWALLLATKTFRGEEDSGRWEVLLAGQTTARRAAVNAMAGLMVCLGVFYIIIATAFIIIGRTHGLDFGASAALFMALTTMVGITLFMMVGALTSQLLPTRGRAAGAAATVLGICFLLRAVGSVTNLHWLLDLNPLGWIDNLQPLAGSRPIWLVPIGGLILILGAATIFLAGRRDLGASIFADNATAKPHTGLLNSPLQAAIRLTRTTNLSWLVGVTFAAAMYGLLTKSAAEEFSQSASASRILTNLAHQQTQVAGATIFLGVVFFLQMVFIMAYAASSVAAIRRDEAEGYLDNFLVGPVGRLRWLAGRLLLTTIVTIFAGLLTTIGIWVGVASQHVSVSFQTLLLASLNTLVPVVVTIGFAVFALGVRPRLTSMVAYGVIAWSFLIEMVSSGIKINHWILDTSVLHHIVLAPAASPNWTTNLILVGASIGFGLLGTAGFIGRDLTTE